MNSSLRLAALSKHLTGSTGSSLPKKAFSTSLSLSRAPVDLAFERADPPSGSPSASDVGRDSPLVIVHGLFGSKQNWRSLSKAFAKTLDRPVYTLDLRNHGTSPHSEHMDYSIMAADVARFCETQSLSDIVLLGHSMGGKVAMALALSPDLPSNLLSQLIVADMSPAIGPISPEFQSYVGAMQKVEEKGVKSKSEADQILLDYEKDHSTRQFLLTNLISPPKGQDGPMKFRIPVDLLGRAIDRIGEFPYGIGERTWDGKVLFIKGKKSKYLNRHNIPIAKHYFPNMQLEILDAGHWVHAERPKEFVDLVAKFVQS